jgi:prepilin-type N-terminal cleavage/methylation domain-containing protein
MRTKPRAGFTLLEIMIVVAIIAMLAAIAIPAIGNSIDKARRTACVLNQQNIDGAKVRWALDKKQPPTATPADADLFGKNSYVEHKPDCPAGGSYALNAVEEKCTCSLPPHDGSLEVKGGVALWTAP